MKKIVFVIIIMSFYANVLAQEIQASETLVKFEQVIISRDNSCDKKQEISMLVNKSVLQELYDRLGDKNVVLRKARERLELMNIVFAYEGTHEWGRDDDRSLHLMLSEWNQMMNPECFDGKTDGFSSKKWLEGAVWALNNVCQ